MERGGKATLVVYGIIWLVIVAGAGFFVGQAVYERGQGTDRETAAYRQGRFDEADAMIQLAEQELRDAQRDENRARSAVEQAEARGRIDALRFIEKGVDADKATYWDGILE